MEREKGSTTDWQFKAVIADIRKREQLIEAIEMASKEIKLLIAKRQYLRTESRKLKNSNIAHSTGLTKGIVDNISRCKYKRINQLDPEFYDRAK
jgi:hypothetical protein